MANRICELLGIRYPIFLGGMAHVAREPLVSAVSKAGGVGIIGAGGMPPDELARQIELVRRATDRPFGVNLMLMDPSVPEQVEVVVRARVPLVTTGAGSPAKYMDALKEAGILVFPVVPAVKLAVRMERLGADGVIAEGMESGGHIGTETTMALVPQIVDAVSVPVVAAGGIADGRGMAAALALGAAGVQVGTRFLASEEAPVHEDYKRAVLKAQDRDTIITGRTLGRPVRCLANKLTKTLARYEAEGRDPEEFESLAVGGLRRAVYEGDLEKGSLMAGQIAGLIRDIKPVAEIIQDMVRKAAEILTRGVDFPTP
ncbi:TPA: enoyl-[acyl-carrier-protein] reductase FabK [Candidatus Bipolaricaulota bacterium]|nr:enoyl-[acyl-carrier-protein] reductase FabK [Candidatus Bipolaricaulota bacterium]HIQ00307.1 enoyl-[acyl-carrier-protein] reductase FabK [Candidatus Bipolaricaulota bacterium]